MANPIGNRGLWLVEHMVTPPINNGEFGTFFIRWTQDSLGKQQLLLKSPTTYRGNMKLLLLVVLGLVAGVLCQVPDEFLVLEEAGPSDELDAGDLKAYSDKASELLRSMGKSGMVDPSTFDSFEDSPEPYTSLAKSNPDGGFQVSSDLVQLAEDAEPLDFSSKRGRRQIVSSNCVGLPLYHCPHTTRILSWFPIRYGSTVHAICFVPWAARQRVTYATC
ncbi:hypothetical protein BaRGS_00015206, partial [Batillaria attramentaria]